MNRELKTGSTPLLLITLVAFLYPGKLLGQIPDTLWSRIFGGPAAEVAYSVCQTSDGGYIMAGYTGPYFSHPRDVYIVKTDSDGNQEWSRVYGGTDWDGAYDVKQTNDKGYIVAGFTKSFGVGFSDVWLLRINRNGDTLWTRTYGGSQGEEAYSVDVTADGGYIVAGFTWSFGEADYDYYLIKTDPMGNVEWTRTYGGADLDWCRSVQQTSDGGYILGGWTHSFGSGYNDAYLVKTDSLGDVTWARTYGGEQPDWAICTRQTADDGYIAVGITNSFGGGGKIYLIKTDADGDTMWTRFLGQSYAQEGWSVQQTSDGGYIIAGGETPDVFGADWDAYIIKTDDDGEVLWERTYGGSEWDGAFSIQQTSDGGYISAGFTASIGEGPTDFQLLRLTADQTEIQDGGENQFAENIRLWKNYPNPFNATTVIRYDLAEPAEVRIEIYDILGRRVQILDQGEQQAGYHQVMWDATEHSSGTYFYRIQAGEYAETRKMVLLK